MGNEIEKMDDNADHNDFDSVGAVGPTGASGSLSPTRSTSTSADGVHNNNNSNNNNNSSSLPNPPSPRQLRNNQRQRQNRLYRNHTNQSCDVDSAAAVGPCLTMNTTTDEQMLDFPSSSAVIQPSKSSFSNKRPMSPPQMNSIEFTAPGSSNTGGSVEKERERRSRQHYNSYKPNPDERYAGKGSSLLGPNSPQRQHVGSPLKNPGLNGSGTGTAAERPVGGGRDTTKKSTGTTSPSPVDVGPELEIEDGTPAAAALKANAQIKVTKVGKAARYMNAQAIKRLVKKTKVWGNRKGSGNKRGKPPRVPEIVRRWSDNDVMVDTVKAELKQIVEDEEDEEQDLSARKSGSGSTSGTGRVGHELDSKEMKSSDFRVIPKKGDEEDPDATYVGYDVEQPPTITLHDKHGKKQEIKMFGKMKERSQKRKDRRESRNYVKGRLIEEEHELYTLSIAVMLGLRYAIYQTHRQLENDKQEKRFWLDSEEFMRMEKYVFRPDGRHNTPPHKLGHTFKFKDYSPVPFAYIRRMFGINEYEFIHSVCGNANFIEFISNAKSGQFFFYSSDGKYMIKTMTNTESKFLRRSE